jgi:GT2 family glycosyltransferase
MNKIAIVAVPYILHQFHKIFMVQTVLSLLSMKHEYELDLIAIVNSFQGSEKDFEFITQSFDVVDVNDKNNLARAWNKGIKAAIERGADYVLVINLDLVFHSQFLNNLVEFAKFNPEAIMWSGHEWSDQENLELAPLSSEISDAAHAACFLIDKRLFEIVGDFDEQFEPAYHEDSDMLYRIKLKKLKTMSTKKALFYHLDRVTLKGAINNGDRDMLDTLRICMDLCMEKYAKKWGGLPGRERYKEPYDGKVGAILLPKNK